MRVSAVVEENTASTEEMVPARRGVRHRGAIAIHLGREQRVYEEVTASIEEVSAQAEEIRLRRRL
jgi:hypothetical protein